MLALVTGVEWLGKPLRMVNLLTIIGAGYDCGGFVDTGSMARPAGALRKRTSVAAVVDTISWLDDSLATAADLTTESVRRIRRRLSNELRGAPAVSCTRSRWR